MAPKISIIMPVYNMADYLDQSTGSATGQSLPEIELICVDDASTDASLKILREKEKKDPRVRVFSFEENQSTWCARKFGVQRARGEYIMFLDADDALAKDACSALYREMKRDPVDILQFDTEVRCTNELSGRELSQLRVFLRPFRKKLSGKAVLPACFSEKHYGYTLWNKIYAAEVCRRALRDAPDLRLYKAEDKLAYFMIAYHARSYRGLPGRYYYQYHYGRGGSASRLPLGEFERICEMRRAADELDRFLKDEDAWDEYRGAAEQFREDLFFNTIRCWKDQIADADKQEAYDMMVSRWSPGGQSGWEAEKLFTEKLIGHYAPRCPETAENRRSAGGKGAEALLSPAKTAASSVKRWLAERRGSDTGGS